jgi:cardiolipin synthase
MDYRTILLLQLAGFAVAIVLVVRLLREKNGPATTLAWLISFALVPYLAVPLYLLIGGRKVRRMLQRKGMLAAARSADRTTDQTLREHFSIESIFPMRPCPSQRLLTDGVERFWVLMELIESARSSIAITTYIFKHDDTGQAILEALKRKAAQGVRVRLLLDGVGSLLFPRKELRKLVRAGGRYGFFMPMIMIPFRGGANLRNHRKIVIVDNRQALIGGINLAGEYLGRDDNPRRWQDLALTVSGPAVQDLAWVFASDWYAATREEIVERQESQGVSPGNGGEASSLVQVIPSGPDTDDDPLHDSILQLLFLARERISIITPYFIPDEMIVKALCMAARRGVAVTIVVPARSNHPVADFARRSFLRQISEAGARICFFEPSMLHGKVIIIDRETAITGSMNMDMRSMFLNYEIAVMVQDASLISGLEAWIEKLVARSDNGVPAASTTIELIEGVSRLLAPLL